MKLARSLATSLLGVGLLAALASGQVAQEQVPPQPEQPNVAVPHAPAAPYVEPARQKLEAEVARLRTQAEALQQQAEMLRAKAERDVVEPSSRPGYGQPFMRPGMGGMGGGGMGSMGGGGMMGGMGAMSSGRATTAYGQPFQEQVERMRSWLDTVDRYTRLARDPSDTGVAAVITANDLLRARGPKGAIEFFNKVLPEVKNDAVRRTIQLQMVELYKATGQQEKALEELQTLMTSAPTMPSMPSMPPMPGMGGMGPMHGMMQGGMMQGMMMPHAPSPAPAPPQPSTLPVPHQEQ